MSRPTTKAPVIIVRRQVAATAHHGGAWKVAYADFVTAMMALFIVLWLLSSSQEVQKVVGGYFTDPRGNGKMVGTTRAGVGDELALHKEDMAKLKDRIEQAIQQLPQINVLKQQIRITVTTEGLRIELLESLTGLFFELGSPRPTGGGKEVLESLAQQLAGIPNAIVIEGHTDGKPYGAQSEYTNWELSTDRANAARRVMVHAGLPEARIAQVRGFADQRLRTPEDPMNASNRRITIIVKYTVSTTDRGTDNIGS
jgi:chemotaxis protein MotB